MSFILKYKEAYVTSHIMPFGVPTLSSNKDEAEQFLLRKDAVICGKLTELELDIEELTDSIIFAGKNGGTVLVKYIEGPQAVSIDIQEGGVSLTSVALHKEIIQEVANFMLKHVGEDVLVDNLTELKSHIDYGNAVHRKLVGDDKPDLEVGLKNLITERDLAQHELDAALSAKDNRTDMFIGAKAFRDRIAVINKQIAKVMSDIKLEQPSADSGINHIKFPTPDDDGTITIVKTIEKCGLAVQRYVDGGVTHGYIRIPLDQLKNLEQLVKNTIKQEGI